MRNQTDERSARGGGDGSSVNNLDEFQISSPLSSFRKSTSNPRLIRRPIKTQFLPELNKNCNHPTAFTEPDHSGLNVVYKTEDDDWYAGEEGDYFDCQPSNGDVTNCMSNSSIYAKDEHQDSITFYSEEAKSSMSSMPFFKENGAGSQCDGGEMIDGINQLIADKCDNGAYAYRGPLGHRDKPMGVMLMSYTDPDALADNMASGSRFGDAGFPLSLREPEGPAGDACEVVFEDIESDEDDESDDEVESNDEKEEVGETVDVCETKENVCSDAEGSDIESEEDSGEDDQETVIESQPEHTKTVLPAHAITDMCAGNVDNALSLRGTVHMMEDVEDEEDDEEEEEDAEFAPAQPVKPEAPLVKPYDEDAALNLKKGKLSVLAPCSGEKTQLAYLSVNNKEADASNNLVKYGKKVWDTSVQTMKSVTRTVTDSLSNSSIDTNSSEEEEEEEVEVANEEVATESAAEEKQVALLQGPCEPEESNPPTSYVSKPQRSYTLLKAKPVKDAAFKKLGQNLLKQNQMKLEDAEDRQPKSQPVRKPIVYAHSKAPIMRPKVQSLGDRSQYQRKLNERTEMLEKKIEPTIPDYSGTKSKNLSKSASNDRVSQYNGKSNSKRFSNDTKTHDKESFELTKQISFADNNRDRKARVNQTALWSSQAKASMRMNDKTMSSAKSETTLKDDKAAPKKTKSSFFSHENSHSQRTRKINKDRDYKNHEDDMPGFSKSPFSQLGIPTEGSTKTSSRSQKFPKESGSSVDPDSDVLRLKAPSDTMAKFSQTAKQTAVRRIQKWRPATGSTSKQLVRLNENANKPSTEQSAIEASNPGAFIDLSSERAESAMSSAARVERDRKLKKMMAFRTESSNGVAKVYCVGAPEEVQSEGARGPVQQVKMYHTKMPKIQEPTVIPEPEKAWYNPSRWIYGSRTPNPVIEHVAETIDKPKKRIPSAGSRHVNKVQPKHPALMNAEVTSKPEGEEERPKTDGKSLAVETKHEPNSASQRPDATAQRPKNRRTPTKLMRHNQDATHDDHSTVSNPCQPIAKDAWKADADRIRQERKERLHLLQKKKGGFVEEEEPVPEKAAGFGRFNRSRTFRPQNMSNGGGHGGDYSPISEPTQPYRPRPARSSFQRRNPGENTNGNAVEENKGEHCTEIVTSVDAADNDASNNSIYSFSTAGRLAQSYEDGYAINATLELLVE